MAIHITRNSSVYTTTPANHAFQGTGPDTLIVDSDAFLIASGSFADGARLQDPWTAIVNGIVAGLANGSSGLALNESNTNNSTTSSVTIGATGEVFGTETGIFCNYSVGGDHLAITNFGLVGGNVRAISSTAATLIRNGGTLDGDVILGAAADAFFNSAKLGTKVKSGTVLGILDLGGGNDGLVNPGIIQGGVTLGTGNDTLTNSGKIMGTVALGDGNDTFANFVKTGKVIKSGVVDRGLVIGISPAIDLGSGDDVLRGGKNAEVVRDDLGTDVYSLGGGNDIYLADFNFSGSNADGLDTINGGAGIDTYHLANADSLFLINIDSIEHSGLAAQTAIEFFGQTDKIVGFENVTGGPGTDVIFGSAGANVLNGGDNNDALYGLGGRDILGGGAGLDTFYFLSLSNSGPTAQTRDVITDFVAGVGEIIDLSAIDANGNAAGAGTFDFIEYNNFTGTRGELRAFFSKGNTVVAGDVNGDGAADFSILLQGHHLLSDADFVL